MTTLLLILLLILIFAFIYGWKVYDSSVSHTGDIRNSINNKATKSNIQIENKRCKEECVYEIKKEWRKCNICGSVQTQYNDKWIDVFNEGGNYPLNINLPTILSGGKEHGCHQVTYYGYNPKKDLRVEIADGGSCPYDYINWNENKQKLVGKHSWIKEIIDDRYCKLYGTEEVFAFITLIPMGNRIVHMKDTIFNMNLPQSEQVVYLFPPSEEFAEQHNLSL